MFSEKELENYRSYVTTSADKLLIPRDILFCIERLFEEYFFRTLNPLYSRKFVEIS